MIALGSALPAAADGIMASEFGDFAFMLPKIGKSWEQEKKPGLILVSDESDGLPDLQVAVFAPIKPGTLREVEARLGAELARPNIVFFGEKVTSFKVDKAADETIATSPFRIGTGTLNGQKAAFAIGQRGGKTIILVGVGNEGVEERALVNFQAIVHKLARPLMTPAEVGAADKAPETDAAPKLGAFAVVKDITASSTFVDKSKKDLYGAWRTLDFTADEEGNPATAWCEGKKDEGIGEGITITFAAPTKLDTINIAAGVWLNEKLFKANNAITSLAVSFDGGTPVKVSPPAEREYVDVKVGKTVSSISIKIDGVKKGKMNDSCISGIQLHRDERLAIVRGLDDAAVKALPAAYAAIWKALSDEKRTGLDKLVTFPFEYAASDWALDGSNRKTQKLANAKELATACAKKKPACPGGPNTQGREDPATVSGGSGSITITFPSRREVVDVWSLEWKAGAWKLISADYTGI